MAAIRKADFARQAGVSPAAVSKACERGALIVTPVPGGDARVDPEHPANAHFLALHAQGYDSRGRPMPSYSRAGRPRPGNGVAAAAVQRGKAAHPSSGSSGRTSPSAGSAAAFDVDGIDLAQAISGLSLGGLASDAALDGELRRLQVSSGALLDLDRLLGNVANSIADGFNREGGMLVAVLNGIDQRLAALEQHAAGNEVAAAFARIEAGLGGQGEATRHRLDGVAEQIRRLIEVLAHHAERR